MATAKDILDYNKTLGNAEKEIVAQLCKLIESSLPKAEGKVWHGHPVWFIDGNPVVGYSLKKAGIEALFWSGQSFATSGLTAIGKFKAAGYSVPSTDVFSATLFKKWLAEAKKIQWDYANLPKKKKLEKLTDF
jgi:hypothetical protein